MGVVYENFRKIWVTKKKISTKLRNFFLKNQFFANFSKQIVFFYVKFAFRMFSAFIWYTYCQCRSKMTNFRKLWYRKLENFRGQSRLLPHWSGSICSKKNWAWKETKSIFKLMYQVTKIHWETNILIVSFLEMDRLVFFPM